MTLREILDACEGRWYGDPGLLDRAPADIVTDSRKAGPGSLFIALRGERTDGHRYIPDVLERGVLAVLCEEEGPAGGAAAGGAFGDEGTPPCGSVEPEPVFHTICGDNRQRGKNHSQGNDRRRSGSPWAYVQDTRQHERTAGNSCRPHGPGAGV